MDTINNNYKDKGLPQTPLFLQPTITFNIVLTPSQPL